MIDTIIFDCDGVVLNSENAWVDSTHVLLGRRGIIYKPEEIRHKLTGKVLRDGTQIMKDFYHLKDNLDDLVKERFELVKKSFETETDFVPGFLEFFDQVKENYKLCVATSINKGIFAIVDSRLQINQLFNQHVYLGENLKDASKPKPDIFLHAAQMVQSEPKTCLVIEDAPNGIEAAKNAGMKCIAISTTFKPSLLTSADIIVKSFKEIDLTIFK